MLIKGAGGQWGWHHWDLKGRMEGRDISALMKELTAVKYTNRHQGHDHM
jgi:hypothetical protein